MVNNEFHIIGIATSNYEDVSTKTSNFKKWRFSVEIEKRGSKDGNTMFLNIDVYGTNRAINTNEEIIGRKIAVSGYLDSWLAKGADEPTMKVVAQSVMLLEEKKQDNMVTAPVEEEQPKTEIEDIVDEEVNDSLAVPDDDLPF